MKKILLILTTILTSVSAVWAEDYSQGYYTLSSGSGTTYYIYYDGTHSSGKYGCTSSLSSSVVVYTFEKTNQENVYYWYDCNNKKYIYADNNNLGYLNVSDSKNENDNSYKWYFQENSDGSIIITDMSRYNNGNIIKGLCQVSAGGWLATDCTLSIQNDAQKLWKFNLLMKKNTPYYISIPGRANNCYLQYGDNKMQQARVTDRDVNHVWYVTDVNNGALNIYSLANQNEAMGYASNAGAGDTKIATTNSEKSIYIRLTGNNNAPLAFLTNASNSSLYISNHGGVGNLNMGLYGTIDDGTRMKVDEISFEDCINTAKDFLEGTHAGHPGFHTYEANAALHSAITTAEGVETPTISDFYSLLNAIKTFKSAETIKLVQGKTYRFVSASTNKPGYVISVNNDNYLIWEALNETNNKQLWKVTWTATGLLATIQNVGTGLYPQGRSLNSTSVIKYRFYLGESATNTQIVDLGSYSGQFNINPNSQHSMHMLNHESSNTTDNIISWDNTDINSPSAWYIYEYEEYNIVVNGCDNGRIIINGTEYADGDKFYIIKGEDINNITTSAKNITYYVPGEISISGNTISVEYTYYPNREIEVPEGYIGYIGGITEIGEAEWKTQEYWKLKEGATWNVGPGYTGSNMWQPIYLKGVTATGIQLEGWAFSADLINSSLTATTKKIQSDWTINVAEGSELELTMTSSESHSDNGTHTFNINGSMTINARPNRFNGINVSDNRVNIGENGYFKLISSSNLSINNSASFTINVTPTEPTNYNEVLSQETPFAVIQNVTFADGKLTFGTTNAKWERVYAYDDLSNKTAAGEHFYYFIEESEFATGEKKYKLYTYKQKIYSRNVTSGNFGSICIPNAVKEMYGIEKVLAVTEVGTDRVVMDVVNVDKMVAGVPYIFKSNDNSISLTLNGETVTEPNNKTQDYLVGNFSPVTVPTSDQNTSYYVLQSNKFKKVTSASSITSGSNRCYLKVTVDPSRQSTLGIAVDEGGATGIDALNALINNNAEIYDINGRKLKDLRRGINIVNGVKVIVK